MKYMPARYKARAGVGGPSRSLSFCKSKVDGDMDIYKSRTCTHNSKVACFATYEYEQLLSEPKERVLKVTKYSNTNFVNLVIERRFYLRLDENAEKLGIEPEAVLSNMFFLTLGKLEQIVAQKGFIEASNKNL